MPGSFPWMEFLPIGLILLVPLVVVLIVGIVLWRGLGRKARSFGYPSTRAFLRAAPATDEEKRHATDLMLKGVIICLLGLLFPPALLVGAVPLFYGGRKVCYASMGLGLIDDSADVPRSTRA
jgi:hypothetical protein